MYIARIQLKNFKSFAGSHDLPLSPGLTAIVGPNGSGKSNILDGLRWGLGDSNGQRLRITRQSDLLFQGTGSLPPSDFAEVLLELREGDSKAVIKRRFSEDGGSVITLNGGKSRLQDLHDLKRNWRLEGDRFAFIGQGDVAEGINCRPMERRLLLEELFGIHLYRKKRDDALSKIHSAEEELARLGVLVSELEARKNQIAPAVSKAEKAMSMEESLDRARAKGYHLKRSFLEKSLKALDVKLKETENLRDIKKNRMELWERALLDLKEKGSSMDAVLEETKKNLLELDESLKSLGARASETEIDLRICEERLKRSEKDSETLKDRMKTLEASRESELKEFQDLRDRSHGTEKILKDLESKQLEAQREIESRRNQKSELIRRKADLKESLEEAISMKEALLARGKERSLEIDSLKKAISDLEGPLEGLSDKETKMKGLLDDLERYHKDADTLCKSLGIRIQPIRKEIYRLEGEIDRLSSASSEGFYPKAVSHLLGAWDLGKIAKRPVPVIEAFLCPKALAQALDAALGGRQFWLLAKTMKEAGDGIDELKRSKAGRVTYLTLDRARPRGPSPLPSDIPKDQVLGWAMDLIEVEDLWRRALEHMIGDLLVVSSYKIGAELASRGCRFQVVTVDGEVFSPSGTISGGATARSGGALKIRSMIKESEESLEKKRLDLSEMERDLKNAETKEKTLAESVGSVSKALGDLVLKKSETEKDLEEKKKNLERLICQEKASKDKIKTLLEVIGQKEAQMAEIRQGLSHFDQIPEDLVQSEILSLKPKYEVLLERMRLSEKSLINLEKDLKTLSEDLDETSLELKGLREKAALKSRYLFELKGLILKYEKEKMSLSDSVKNLERKGKKHGALVERCIGKSAGASREFAHILQTLEALTQRAERDRKTLKELLESWEERFPYPGEGLSGNLEETEKDIRRIEAGLRALGDFDRGALSENRSIGERLDYYGREMYDVQSAIEELRSIVKEADQNAGKAFKEALERIDRKFNGLFTGLMGGGEAHLKLLSDGGLWDSGVDIIARPPGRVQSHLSQLSGGEQSLTALSLLFSSMEVAEVPLAVLDEVDAALDEVNLRRFSDILADYALSTQILVMTHRRQTMERAHVMFGVTMSEPGLSQVVGVKLDDWR